MIDLMPQLMKHLQQYCNQQNICYSCRRVEKSPHYCHGEHHEIMCLPCAKLFAEFRKKGTQKKMTPASAKEYARLKLQQYLLEKEGLI